VEAKHHIFLIQAIDEGEWSNVVPGPPIPIGYKVRIKVRAELALCFF
jgi:hypothetical protein